MNEYYIERVLPDGYEDTMWYTEEADEITEQEAVNRWAELCLGNGINYKLYKIDRSLPKPHRRELVIERPRSEMVVVPARKPPTSKCCDALMTIQDGKHLCSQCQGWTEPR